MSLLCTHVSHLYYTFWTGVWVTSRVIEVQHCFTPYTCTHVCITVVTLQLSATCVCVFLALPSLLLFFCTHVYHFVADLTNSPAHGRALLGL